MNLGLLRHGLRPLTLTRLRPARYLTTPAESAATESSHDQSSSTTIADSDMAAMPRPISTKPAAKQHQLHIFASYNNTIITLTKPDGSPLVTTSGGSAGFKKAARGGYEAAHQAANQLLAKMTDKNIRANDIHVIFKGFGPGRDAAYKALVAGRSWKVKRITDATPVPFNGCRPPKTRRL
ncbi:hypothetical protein BZG36_02501 [Bifiguratus adelaidae]|uniref:30S ribosomal protein S11 n=1 Tax=Bifiguratus adelaidae TaxID=1938954 RepID=A0A261Y2N2_9FUNG|nr:hypothetical protein BZG36_02501 [Bifiguratus adelaidae]